MILYKEASARHSPVGSSYEEGSVPIRKSMICHICTWRETSLEMGEKEENGSHTKVKPYSSLEIRVRERRRERESEQNRSPKQKGQFSHHSKEKAGNVKTEEG